MAKGLTHKHIAIAASRKTDEMIEIIERQGGTGAVRSLQGTIFPAGDTLKPSIEEVFAAVPEWYIFTTGIGVKSMIETAEQMGKKEMFINLLKEADVAVRGYKTYNAMKELGVVPAVRDDDGTTKGLMRQMGETDIKNKKVMVQLHGVSSPVLYAFLENKGAEHILEVLPYQHIEPDEQTVQLLCDELKSGTYHAICFTTAIQVHSLFRYAEKNGGAEDVRFILTEKTTAVSVGKVTTEALHEEGVGNVVAPENERMGAMIIALAKHLESTT